jgi:hypothetical protein
LTPAFNRIDTGKLPQEPRSVPRLRADGLNRVSSWDISFPPARFPGVWLYLYLVAAKASGSRSSSTPTTAMPSRSLLEELRGATLESRLEAMGVLRSLF